MPLVPNPVAEKRSKGGWSKSWAFDFTHQVANRCHSMRAKRGRALVLALMQETFVSLDPSAPKALSMPSWPKQRAIKTRRGSHILLYAWHVNANAITSIFFVTITSAAGTTGIIILVITVYTTVSSHSSKSKT